MGTITALTAQKRNQDRINVYLDGEFTIGLAASVARTLQVGQTLSPHQLTALQDQDSFEKAKEIAVRLISLRPRSVTEIQNHLRKKGFDTPISDQIVNYLQEIELLDDLSFARYWVEQRETFKPRSRLFLQQELQQKGVSMSVIETALADIDETITAQRAAEKQARRWVHLPEDQFRQKLGQFLQRRGFSYHLIRQVVDESWETRPVE